MKEYPFRAYLLQTHNMPFDAHWHGFGSRTWDTQGFNTGPFIEPPTYTDTPKFCPLPTACLTGMRHLDDIEAWSARAEAEMTLLSGKSPRALRAVLTEWPPSLRPDG